MTSWVCVSNNAAAHTPFPSIHGPWYPPYIGGTNHIGETRRWDRALPGRRNTIPNHALCSRRTPITCRIVDNPSSQTFFTGTAPLRLCGMAADSQSADRGVRCSLAAWYPKSEQTNMFTVPEESQTPILTRNTSATRGSSYLLQCSPLLSRSRPISTSPPFPEWETIFTFLSA